MSWQQCCLLEKHAGSRLLKLVEKTYPSKAGSLYDYKSEQV